MASGSVFPTILSATSSDDPIRIKTFDAFIDVLLPSDEISPSGTSIGVARDLLELSEGSQLYKKLVSVGCDWLDSTGAGTFDDLSDGDQIAVVRWMSNADWNQIPRRFYHLTRQAAVSLYFSSEYATAGLPLNEAPQPLGYLPPWT